MQSLDDGVMLPMLWGKNQCGKQNSHHEVTLRIIKKLRNVEAEEKTKNENATPIPVFLFLQLQCSDLLRAWGIENHLLRSYGLTLGMAINIVPESCFFFLRV